MYSLVFSYITACPFQDLSCFTLSSIIFNYFPPNLSTDPLLFEKTFFLPSSMACRLTQFYNFDEPYIYIKISWANQTDLLNYLHINKQCERKCDILRLLSCAPKVSHTTSALHSFPPEKMTSPVTWMLQAKTLDFSLLLPSICNIYSQVQSFQASPHPA